MATLLHESQIAWARPTYYPAREVRKLETELKERIKGEVRSRVLYATTAPTAVRCRLTSSY